MRHLGLVLFALLSLMVHVTAAAVFMSEPDAIEEARGAGTAALEVGNLFDSAASDAVEPKTLDTVRQQPPTLAPVPTRRAIEVKTFNSAAVVPTPVEPPQTQEMVTAALAELTANEALREPDLIKPRDVPPAKEQETPPEVTAIKSVEAPAIREVKPVKTAKLTKIEPAEESEDEAMDPAPAFMPKAAPRPKDMSKPRRVAKAVPAPQAPSKASRKGGITANASGTKGQLGGNGGKEARAAGEKLVSNYRGKISTKLRRRLVYPSSAKRRGLSGTSTVRFVIASNGSANSIKLIRSSGHPQLDEAALSAVRRASPFPPHPGDYRGGPITVTVPLGFGS